MANENGIQIEEAGARLYVTGNTYAVRDKLKAAGCHWDGERKAWWIGTSKRDAITSIVSAPVVVGAASASTQRVPEAPGLEAVVSGRAEYKGRTYYIAGRVVRGRTHWDDTVRAVESRDGSRVLLYFRDGSRQFWAAVAEVKVLKTYRSGATIESLREYAERMKREKETGTCECRCHNDCACNQGRFCSLHHDGCERCGCEA